MKKIFFLTLAIALLIGLMSGCGAKEEPTEPQPIPFDETAAWLAVNQWLETRADAFEEEFGIRPTFFAPQFFIGETQPRYSEDKMPVISVSIHMDISVPEFTDDLLARHETRTLERRDVELGQAMIDFFDKDDAMEGFQVEGHVVEDTDIFCMKLYSGDYDSFSFTVHGSLESGYAEINQNGKLFYYHNVSYESNYYSQDEYNQNARPYTGSSCPCCRGSGSVVQYATNYWWDEGYIASCQACD